MKGYIRKRGRAWELFLELPSDSATGTRRRQTRTVNGTKMEAQRVLTELMQQVNIGAIVNSSRSTTLGDFLSRWIEYKASQVRPVTLRRYRGIVEGNVISHIGDVPLVRLEPQHRLDLYKKLSEGGQRREARGSRRRPPFLPRSLKGFSGFWTGDGRRVELNCEHGLPILAAA